MVKNIIAATTGGCVKNTGIVINWLGCGLILFHLILQTDDENH